MLTWKTPIKMRIWMIPMTGDLCDCWTHDDKTTGNSQIPMMRVKGGEETTHPTVIKISKATERELTNSGWEWAFSPLQLVLHMERDQVATEPSLGLSQRQN
jgi:hypothetical protein